MQKQKNSSLYASQAAIRCVLVETPPIMLLTRLVEAQRCQLFTFTLRINCEIIRSLIYTGRSGTHMYTERAKLGFKRSDNWLIFRDNNGSMPLVMGTGKNYWSEMLFSDSWYWWFSFEVWGLFLFRRKRPQWSLLTASHWTNAALPNLLLIQRMGGKGGFAFLFVQTFLVNSIPTNQII